MAPLRRLFILAILFCATVTLTAAASAQDVGLQFDTIVRGRAKPALVFQPDAKIKKLTVKLSAAGHGTQTLRSGAIGAGRKKRLTFRHRSGTAEYTAEIAVVWADGKKQRFESAFSATRMGDPKIFIKAEDVDLDDTVLTCTFSNPARAISLTLHLKSGESVEVIERFEDPHADAGDDLTISWEDVTEEIVRMDLKVTDIAGFWAGIRITPFSIEIPHEEVVFESGRSAVRASEEPKLRATMGHINKALAQHGTLLSLKLFVAGYTDTVGGKGSNMELSTQRARSIAGWFRKHGLKLPIYYQGFGEGVLAVPTVDEVEEERNRRALYILSSHVPSGKDVPGRRWKRL